MYVHFVQSNHYHLKLIRGRPRHCFAGSKRRCKYFQRDVHCLHRRRLWYKHKRLTVPLVLEFKLIFIFNVGYNSPSKFVYVDIEALGGLPPNEDRTMHIACKKAANISHYHARTAGIMAILRPCRIVTDWQEMDTSESSIHLFVQLLKVRDEEGSNVKFVGYDRACELVPFLRNTNSPIFIYRYLTRSLITALNSQSIIDLRKLLL